MIKKIIFVIKRKIISYINYFNANLYTKFYSNELKKMGMTITNYPRYIDPSVWFDGQGYNMISIGKDCVISRDVVLLVHDYSITRGLQALGEISGDVEKDFRTLNAICIDENSFVGAKSVILPGTIIGKNCIIGAGSVVRGRVADDSIVIGNPAKVVGNTLEWAKKKKPYAIQEK